MSHLHITYSQVIRDEGQQPHRFFTRITCFHEVVDGKIVNYASICLYCIFLQHIHTGVVWYVITFNFSLRNLQF